MLPLLLGLAFAVEPPSVEEPEAASLRGPLVDCGLVPGETYWIGLRRLQMPDGTVIEDWGRCVLPLGVRLSLRYDEVPSVEPQAEPNKQPIQQDRKQRELDSSPQAVAASRVATFLEEHTEVELMEARVAAPCDREGRPDPSGHAAAVELAERMRSLGVDPQRVRIMEAVCSGTGEVRIEAVVVRTSPVKGPQP